MAKMKNNLWLSDIDKIIASLPELDELSGKSILITGAGGLICSAVVDVLIRYNETKSSKVRIISAGRNPEKLCRRFGIYSQRDYFTCIKYNALSENNNIMNADYIIHGAGNAYPLAMSAEPVETMLANFIGLNSLLEMRKNTKGGGGAFTLYIKQ